jgi:predicted ATPase/class 3 adenylate cyclase
VREHPLERPWHAVEIERVDDPHPVLELPVPEEPPELGLDRLLPMRGLLLVGAERTQVSLRREQLLHRRRPEGTRQLVLQVRIARIEAELLEIGAREDRAEARSSESPPEVALFRAVIETSETYTEPRGPVPFEEPAEVPITAHRDDRHAFGSEVAALSARKGLDGCAVALSLDEEDGPRLRVGHSASLGGGLPRVPRLHAVASRSLELPSGTVTLLFTDIEGSTALAERVGDRWPGLLAEHNRILREAFSVHGGIELGAEGDAFFVAFRSAAPAAAAAAAAQRALASHAWPDGEVIRVRMGLHTGEPTPTADGYVGLDMHRAARVAAAAHGGQVLISQSTRDLLPEILEGGTFRDLGDHRLKDLSGPQRLHQLSVEGLTVDFPPPRTIEGRVTNLPAQPTPLVGRDRELEAVRALLLAEGTRMVTLTGPGGTGKTRVALQVAADTVDEFPDGVYGVLLAPVTDPDVVPLELARVLRIEEMPPQPIVEALKAGLAGRRTLILFDNFEHVGAAAALLADLLAACPRLKVLVTSREPLRIAAERQYPVPPLPESDCVMLFVERARAVRPDFELTDETAPIVAEICERLDGLPLAVELAAAWSKVLPPAALLRRLERRLELPASRSADVPARQSTLREAIAWSYDLLSDEERRLHARLSVFMGCTVDAAERVADPDGELGIDVLEGIASLVDRSLLRESEDGEGEPRFGMLATIREYAREHLRESGEEDDVLRRHALEFARFVEQAEAGLRGGDQLLWFSRLENEHDNLRAALDSSAANGDDETALRLGGALGWFWYAHGHALEGCARLIDLLARTENAPEELRARPMYALGVLLDQRGEPERAAELVERSLAVFRAHGEQESVARALNSLGGIKRALGDLESARSLLEQSIHVRRELGDEPGTAAALTNLGSVAFEQSDLDEAEARFTEALELDRAHGNEWGAAVALEGLAAVALERGDYERADELVRDTLAAAEPLGDRELTAFGLEKAAVLAAAEGNVPRAGRFAGAAEGLRESGGFERSRFDREWLERHLSAVAGEEFEAGRVAGQVLEPDEALREAMEQPSTEG